MTAQERKERDRCGWRSPQGIRCTAFYAGVRDEVLLERIGATAFVRPDGKVALCKRHRAQVDAKLARLARSEYPKVLWCPSGHGSTTFATKLEEQLAGSKCPSCSVALVAEEPRKSIPRKRSEYRDLPTLPTPHHAALPQVVSALQAGRHVYLAGPPGTGKSELARQAAESLGLDFYTVACDSSMTRSVLMGLIDAGGNYHRTPLREALEHGGVYLLDEIDNGNPSLLAALNSGMSNSSVSFPDATVAVHDDFRVVATANTWGTGPTADFIGRLRVDPATLDRFARVHVTIDEALEEKLSVLAAGGDEELGMAAVRAVRRIRRGVEVEGLKLVVSPRASMQVAALTARGWSLRDALLTTAIGTLDARKANQFVGEES